MTRILKSIQRKNGGAEVGGWCEREFQDEADEEAVELDWTRRKLDIMEKEQLTKKAGAALRKG